MQQIANGGRGLFRLAADPGAVEAAFPRAETARLSRPDRPIPDNSRLWRRLDLIDAPAWGGCTD
ncbi:hypothetical protein HMPREF0185_00643 [Brevundimonas diminuta 470-4]|nr:hypothetical protein HMPREF0185_00643 [Brevundimonas diminuta 470-4]